MERQEDIELQETFSEIESERFRGYANLASSYRMFTRLIRESTEYRTIARLLHSPRSRGLLLARVHRLASSEVDPRLENPWDAALATYVLAMYGRHRLFGVVAAAGARVARQTWWLAHALAAVSVAPLVTGVGVTSTGPLPERKQTVAHNLFVTPDPFRQCDIGRLIDPTASYFPVKAANVSEAARAPVGTGVTLARLSMSGSSRQDVKIAA